MNAIRRYVMMSRPGMWGVTSAVYMFAIPDPADLRGWMLWLGLALVVVPMNFIACAWNDLRDADVDAHCKRKTTQDNLLVNAFGMAYDHQQMAWVPRTIVLSTLAVGALMMWAGASLLGTVVLVTSFLFANASYNEKPFQLSRRGPLELLIVIYVYLHALFLPSMVSDLPGPSLVLVIIAALYVAALQLAGEITDMKTDKIQGKITTAVLLGQKGAIWTCRVVLVVLAYLCFREDMLGLLAVSGVGLGWLFVPMKRARSQASVLYVIFALYPVLWLIVSLMS